MKTPLRSVLVAALCLAAPAGAALAQAPPPATAVRPPAPVAEVVITPAKDAKVAQTYPADGASIPAGTVVVKIVFDQPMTPYAWSYGKSDAGEFPSCLAKPRLLADQRTFVLLCSLRSGHTYALQINGAPGFVTTAGRAPPPYLLHFTTNDPSITDDLDDALKLAGLTDADDPIMQWNSTPGTLGSVAPRMVPAPAP